MKTHNEKHWQGQYFGWGGAVWGAFPKLCEQVARRREEKRVLRSALLSFLSTQYSAIGSVASTKLLVRPWLLPGILVALSSFFLALLIVCTIPKEKLTVAERCMLCEMFYKLRRYRTAVHYGRIILSKNGVSSHTKALAYARLALSYAHLNRVSYSVRLFGVANILLDDFLRSCKAAVIDDSIIAESELKYEREQFGRVARSLAEFILFTGISAERTAEEYVQIIRDLEKSSVDQQNKLDQFCKKNNLA